MSMTTFRPYFPADLFVHLFFYRLLYNTVFLLIAIFWILCVDAGPIPLLPAADMRNLKTKWKTIYVRSK